MFEHYGHHDGHCYPPQTDTSVIWPQPDHEQHAAHGQQLLGLGLGEMNGPWDPAEELAQLFQEALGPRQAGTYDGVGFGETGGPGSTAGLVTGLSHGTDERPHTPPPNGHRRTPPKTPAVNLLNTGSLFTALLVAVLASVVSLFSGLAICDALRHSAGPRTAHDVVSWWPLLIYGPWIVASLSILRAALHQRRAVHSWSIVLLFSTLATLLCVAQAPRTFAALAAATLPPIATLACFQQLVRQITLTRPPRQPAPRHRNPTPFALRQSGTADSPGHTLSEYSVLDRRVSRPASSGRRFHDAP